MRNLSVALSALLSSQSRLQMPLAFSLVPGGWLPVSDRSSSIIHILLHLPFLIASQVQAVGLKVCFVPRLEVLPRLFQYFIHPGELARVHLVQSVDKLVYFALLPFDKFVIFGAQFLGSGM